MIQSAWVRGRVLDAYRGGARSDGKPSTARRGRCLRLESLEDRFMLSGTAPVAQDDLYTVAPNDALEVLQTTTVAECGFNDASGIHSDATADSPYDFGSPIHGRSSAEAD